MMFLLKAAFWLGLVLVLLPTGSKKQTIDGAQINAAEAATAATGAFADLSQFCTRRPDTCAVGSRVATILGQRAQAGAVMVYEFITERRETAVDKGNIVPSRDKTIAVRHGSGRADTTGSIGVSTMPNMMPAALIPRPRPEHSQDTLTTGDRETAWRGLALRQEAQLRAASN